MQGCEPHLQCSCLSATTGPEALARPAGVPRSLWGSRRRCEARARFFRLVTAQLEGGLGALSLRWMGQPCSSGMRSQRHCVTSWITQAYGTVVTEDLKTKNMTQSKKGNNRSPWPQCASEQRPQPGDSLQTIRGVWLSSASLCLLLRSPALGTVCPRRRCLGG